ncbi:hypothetical protein JOC77_004329 [Peribacillus deserti]|uniref:Toxin SymE-like domain-containing protein n=1 Tax=Peribacillus deserti TaxID=673318 RepID=A0ABS2QNV6_9BACI|nr:hypothetical protein [Peribacillus deserti]MBM7694850.1 hypothetical protein [Peribacillus deserti]
MEVNTSLIEKQTPDRHKTSGGERPVLPLDGDWLMTEGVSPQLDTKRKAEDGVFFKRSCEGKNDKFILNL